MQHALTQYEIEIATLKTRINEREKNMPLEIKGIAKIIARIFEYLCAKACGRERI